MSIQPTTFGDHWLQTTVYGGVISVLPVASVSGWIDERLENVIVRSLKARANARNNTQHCWAQQCCLLLRDVSRCVQTLAKSHRLSQHVGSLDENRKGLWDVFHLRRHVDFLFACICVDTWHVVRVRRRNIVKCAVQTNATLLDHASMTAKQ